MSYKVPPIFEPNRVINIFDDFLCMELSTGGSMISQIGWLNIGIINMNPVTSLSSSHPGVISNPATVTDYGIFTSGSQVGTTIYPSIILGGGEIELHWVINVAILSDGTNTYTLRAGLGDTITGDEVNGVYFEYTHSVNSGNWVCKTSSASTQTSSNSSVAATGWTNLGIKINAAATSAGFYINGTLSQTIATNIPSAAISPIMYVEQNAGSIASDTTIIDLFSMQQTLTTGR